MRTNAWLKYEETERSATEILANRYKDFLSNCKTERECTDYFVKEAEKNGYQSLEVLIEKGEKLQPGDRIYASCMGKALALFRIGTGPLTDGMNILCAHIDSPRLDLKQNPLY